MPTLIFHPSTLTRLWYTGFTFSQLYLYFLLYSSNYYYCDKEQKKESVWRLL